MTSDMSYMAERVRHVRGVSGRAGSWRAMAGRWVMDHCLGPRGGAESECGPSPTAASAMQPTTDARLATYLSLSRNRRTQRMHCA